MNAFMNFVNKFLAEGETRGGVWALEKVGTLGQVGASGEVRASLLLALDLLAGPWAPASSSCFVRLSKGLTQGIRWVIQNSGAIAKDESLNVILLNELADLFSMKLLEL